MKKKPALMNCVSTPAAAIVVETAVLLPIRARPIPIVKINKPIISAVRLVQKLHFTWVWLFL